MFILCVGRWLHCKSWENLQACILCPVLARIINTSLPSAVIPPPMKHAVVTPILKKRCSDVNILTNYRPISNIAFVAKITERFVAQQLQRFMDVNGIYGVDQSAYRPQHSAETALLRIHNDVAQSIDSRRSVLLVLLDLTAAFDTIDHNILMRRLLRIVWRCACLANIVPA